MGGRWRSSSNSQPMVRVTNTKPWAQRTSLYRRTTVWSNRDRGGWNVLTGLQRRRWRSSWGLCANPSFTIGINICKSNCCSWRGTGGVRGTEKDQKSAVHEGKHFISRSVGRRRAWRAEIVISLGEPQHRWLFLWLGHGIIQWRLYKNKLKFRRLGLVLRQTNLGLRRLNLGDFMRSCCQASLVHVIYLVTHLVLTKIHLCLLLHLLSSR
jgi:hypothetical protein